MAVAQPAAQVVEESCPLGRAVRGAPDGFLPGGDGRIQVGGVARPPVAGVQPDA